MQSVGVHRSVVTRASFVSWAFALVAQQFHTSTWAAFGMIRNTGPAEKGVATRHRLDESTAVEMDPGARDAATGVDLRDGAGRVTRSGDA